MKKSRSKGRGFQCRFFARKAEQRSIPEVYDLGMKYAAYPGTEPDNIHIDYMTKIGNTFVMRDSEKDLRRAGQETQNIESAGRRVFPGPLHADLIFA